MDANGPETDITIEKDWKIAHQVVTRWSLDGQQAVTKYYSEKEEGEWSSLVRKSMKMIRAKKFSIDLDAGLQ